MLLKRCEGTTLGKCVDDKIKKILLAVYIRPEWLSEKKKKSELVTLLCLEACVVGNGAKYKVCRGGKMFTQEQILPTETKLCKCCACLTLQRTPDIRVKLGQLHKSRVLFCTTYLCNTWAQGSFIKTLCFYCWACCKQLLARSPKLCAALLQVMCAVTRFCKVNVGSAEENTYLSPNCTG